ncbi:hypothetical protein J6590_043712, partial [Homalodisca vitripennis]
TTLLYYAHLSQTVPHPAHTPLKPTLTMKPYIVLYSSKRVFLMIFADDEKRIVRTNRSPYGPPGWGDNTQRRERVVMEGPYY